MACDSLCQTHDSTGGRDDRVSIEVDPRFAYDTDKTIAEAKSLRWLFGRRHAMIKIPATEPGLAAITAVVALGIRVNVTLIFSLDRYRKVMESYLARLEMAHASGIDVSKVRSLRHSLFRAWTRKLKSGWKNSTRKARESCAGWLGRECTSCARGVRVDICRLALGHPPSGRSPKQRPLWASTGVKDPAHDDTMYVVELVAPNTGNTMPEATLNAVADHGVVSGPKGTAGYDDARQLFADLRGYGIDIEEVTSLLEHDGVQKFIDSWNDLLEDITDQVRLAGRQ
jgi:transaldolase